MWYKPITICGRSYPSTCVVYKRVHRLYKKATKKVAVFVRREAVQLPGQLSQGPLRGFVPWIIMRRILND